MNCVAEVEFLTKVVTAQYSVFGGVLAVLILAGLYIGYRAGRSSQHWH